MSPLACLRISPRLLKEIPTTENHRGKISLRATKALLTCVGLRIQTLTEQPCLPALRSYWLLFSNMAGKLTENCIRNRTCLLQAYSLQVLKMILSAAKIPWSANSKAFRCPTGCFFAIFYGFIARRNSNPRLPNTSAAQHREKR